MRTISSLSRVLMWIAFGITTLIQVAAMYGISANNEQAVKLDQTDAVYDLTPFILAVVLMAIGVILFTVLKKHRVIGLCISAVASVAFIFIALDLANEFGVHIGSSGEDVGLSSWDVVYRHMSPVLVTAFMLVSWFFARSADKVDALAAAAWGKSSYDLSGTPIFADTRSTIGIDDTPAQIINRPLLTKKERRKRKKNGDL